MVGRQPKIDSPLLRSILSLSTMSTVNLSISESVSGAPMGEVTHIVVYKNGSTQPGSQAAAPSVSLAAFEDLKNQMESLRIRLRYLEEAMVQSETVHKPSPYFGSVQGAPAGMDVRRMTDASPLVVPPTATPIKTVFEQLVSAAIPSMTPAFQLDTLSGDEAELEETEKECEEEAEEAEEAEEEAEEAEEDAEGEEEGEEAAMELKEFTYKNVTYYRDDENQVYKLDDDGDLDETPVGVWNEEKSKILWYPK
jgi:hypothetical protein